MPQQPPITLYCYNCRRQAYSITALDPTYHLLHERIAEDPACVYYAQCFRCAAEKRPPPKLDTMQSLRQQGVAAGLSQFYSCARKNRYPTKVKAEEWLAKRERASGLDLKCYYCKYCSGWHIARVKGEASQ